MRRPILFAAASLLTVACTTRRMPPVTDEHTGMDHGTMSAGASVAGAGQDRALPPDANTAKERLAASPRHGEWIKIPTGVGTDSVRAWVVYPERKDKAPVVLVVHEIFGLSPWIRGVADQLAAEGFIAIAPDLLTGLRPDGFLDEQPDTARALIRTLDPARNQQRLDALASYGMSLPAATKKYGIVGYCWGGSMVWNHAVHAGERLGAGVVYYGTSPARQAIVDSVRAPLIGFYGGNDARVNSTIPQADSAIAEVKGATFSHWVYDGAGHGFLRQQDGAEGANLKATRDAWPRTVAFFRERLR